MKAPILLAFFGLAQAAELTGTLTLACEGTVTDKTDPRVVAKPEPVSMGLMFDFTSNTVAGLIICSQAPPGRSRLPLSIKRLLDLTGPTGVVAGFLAL